MDISSLPETVLFLDPLPVSFSDVILTINNSVTLELTHKELVQGIINFPVSKFNLITLRSKNESKFGNYGYIFTELRYARLRFDNENQIYVVEELHDKSRISFRYMQTIFKMVDYNTDIHRGAVNDWNLLTGTLNNTCIDALRKIINPAGSGNVLYVDTHMVASQDVELVSPVLESTRGNDAHDLLHFTYINFKTKDAIRPGHEMQDFDDASHYLRTLVRKQRNVSGFTATLLDELHLSFVLGCTLANYSCFMHWHRVLELFLKSKDKVEVIKYLQKSAASDLSSLSYTENYLLRLYQLVFQQWALLNWEYKLHFINVPKWTLFLERIETSIASMEVDSAELERIVSRARRQLASLAREADEDPVPGTADVDAEEVEELMSDEELNSDVSSGEMVDIYGSSEDEYAPVAVSSVTYRRAA